MRLEGMNQFHGLVEIVFGKGRFLGRGGFPYPLGKVAAVVETEVAIRHHEGHAAQTRYRFGGAASEAGGNMMLSSLAFGEVLIGRAMIFRSDLHEPYFVFGMMLDDLATPDDGEDQLSDRDQGDVPLDEIPAEELIEEGVTLDTETR